MNRLSLLVAVPVVGCGGSVKIEPAAVPEVVDKLQTVDRGATITLQTNRHPIQVTDRMEPQLRFVLDRPCSFVDSLQGRCENQVSAPLHKVSIEGGRVRIRTKGGLLSPAYQDLIVHPREIKQAWLDLQNWDPPGWRPTLGVGYGLAGPSGPMAPEVQWLPARWLGLQAGAVPFPETTTVFAAARVRGVGTWAAHPFLGAFVNVGATQNRETGEKHRYSGAGPRAGVEVELVGGHWLIAAEFDLVHPLGRDRRYWFDLSGEWLPMGGVSGAYFF